MSATAIGRRLGLPRHVMTLLGGESLLNDATALTAYKVALGLRSARPPRGAAGCRRSRSRRLAASRWVWRWAPTVFVRWRLDDPLVESAIGLVATFFIYLAAEEVDGSGVIAVVVAALLLGQKSTRAGYATRLQDTAVWKALQLLLESFAFLMIGLQLPMVVGELAGISASVIAISSAAVLATVILVRIVWVFLFAYLPRMLFKRIRDREPAPTPAQVFVVAWAGMRGVVSLAAAFGVPMTTLAGAPFPGPPAAGVPNLCGRDRHPAVARPDAAVADPAARRAGRRGAHRRDRQAAAQDKAARAAAERLDELLAEEEVTDVHERAADVLRGWNTRRRNSAWERLGRDAEEIGESPASAFRRLRLEMLAAERATFIAERDNGKIDDEVLRDVLRGLDLEEATLNRG